ncbi:hypothetical protein E9993_18815 [Labilibacter sediminis]|nr:hypothetical protein E9993_18815 [Labilibacter sediminis]
MLSKLRNRIIGYDIFALAFVFVLAYSGFKKYFIEEKVLQRKKHTVGETVKHVLHGNLYVVEYKYKINGKEYFNSQRNKIKVKVPNGKYVVIFDSVNVENSIILFDQRLSDEVLVPENGMETIPASADL